MALVGFEEVEVAVFDPAGETVTESFVWKDKDGGTVNITITGLEAETSSVYASNKRVWMSKKGTGDVTSTFESFNPPEDDLDKVLGRDKDENGSSWIGEETQAPYVAMIAKSSDANGEPVYMALPKGIMGLNEITAATREQGATAPSNTTLTGTWENTEIDGKDRIYGKHVGSEGYDAFRNLVFPGLAEEPAV
ncbi:major tail protein [Salinicoccus roseus]|uniref:Phage tail protein n=1 Tax=Salinicoccus roseus TaxID=45670 RepID=A0A265E691_9STAP|nr:major tail protein [Salinicoccus roseus]OZT77111.1 hypothetical protein CFN03_08525 [Salinicoccus roseus]